MEEKMQVVVGKEVEKKHDREIDALNKAIENFERQFNAIVVRKGVQRIDEEYRDVSLVEAMKLDNLITTQLPVRIFHVNIGGSFRYDRLGQEEKISCLLSMRIDHNEKVGIAKLLRGEYNQQIKLWALDSVHE